MEALVGKSGVLNVMLEGRLLFYGLILFSFNRQKMEGLISLNPKWQM
jgi:ABC-type uncharacterized transport system permease subunit